MHDGARPMMPRGSAAGPRFAMSWAPANRLMLGLVSVRTRVPVTVSNSVSDTRVSIALGAVPFEDGLRRLLPRA